MKVMERKDAIEVIKKNYPASNFTGLREALETLIPELKESESEKIRKWLISQLKIKLDDTNSDLNTMIDKAISWLENRIESNPYSGVSFEYNGHTWGMCARDNGIDILLDSKLLKHLEEQDIKDIPLMELKAKAYDDARDRMRYAYNKNRVPLGFVKEIFPNISLYKIQGKQESQDESVLGVTNEQKINNVDQIIPKFHKDEWIACNEHNTALIVNAGTKLYKAEFIDGSRSFLQVDYVDKVFHHWTIKDAKDGDVLQLGKVTVIFKKYIGNEQCKCYCSVYDKEFQIPNLDEINRYGCYNATPATKEQRDALLKMMTDAGYTFDFKEKQLKKIEQESTNKVESVDKYEGFTDFERTLADICQGWINEEPGWEQYIKDNADALLKIAAKESNSVQDNTSKEAWSERDERMLEDIMFSINEESIREGLQSRGINYSLDTLSRLRGSLINWVKAFKDRVQFQSTWKPSKEQLDALEHFVRSIGESGYASSYDNKMELLRLLLFDLKKLKE